MKRSINASECFAPRGIDKSSAGHLRRAQGIPVPKLQGGIYDAIGYSIAQNAIGCPDCFRSPGSLA